MFQNGKRWTLVAAVWTLGLVSVTSHSADEKAEYLKDCTLEIGTAGQIPWSRHPVVHPVVQAHLEKVRALYVAAVTDQASEVDQLVRVFSSTTFLPTGSVLHVAEMREEYYFALLPLLVRPD